MKKNVKNYLFIDLQCINLILVLCFLFTYNLFIDNANDFEIVFFAVYIVLPIISIILWIIAVLFNLKNNGSKIQLINFYVPFLINLGFLNLYNIYRFGKYILINPFHTVIIFAPLTPLILIISFLKNNKNNLNSVFKYIFNIILMLIIFAAYIWLALIYILVHYYSSLGV